MAAPPTISRNSNACLRSFQTLCATLKNPECPFLDQLSLTTVLDELGRFKVWGGNIGAFQDVERQSSCDYRLREASHIRRQIITLLKDLNIALEEGKSNEKIMSSTVSITVVSSFVNYFLRATSPGHSIRAVRCRVRGVL